MSGPFSRSFASPEQLTMYNTPPSVGRKVEPAPRLDATHREFTAMMKAAKQFSVFLVNKPGILSQVCDALADKKVNVIAITLMDSVEHGVFRLVPEDVEKARSVLKRLNIPTTETDVLSVEMPNRPGALADLCSRLNAEHISIKYAYVTSGAAGGRTVGIFKVDNLQKALKVTAPRRPGRKDKLVVKMNRGGRNH